ncbi:hypothetical protein H5410_059722 [Solanum commersonii]|uniref:Uncharacterized protein n=1 Tax=Solanum commersonii TaxID=4109 RepID=A0A9J5W3U1_SOLCO|nr:hypothetical protein H5410_059722 [Solanum commersonii]
MPHSRGPTEKRHANLLNETNSHLFLHCRVTGQLWSLFLRLTGNSWTMPEHTADLLSCWIRRGGSKSQKKWWRIIPACIWWSVWKERNGRCYENKSNSIQKVKENCIAHLYFWCKQECIEEVEQLEAEVNNHLFIHCQIVTSLWNRFLCILGVSWVMPKTTLELLNSWLGVGSRGKKEEWWKLIPSYI